MRSYFGLESPSQETDAGMADRINELTHLLEQCWTRETSADPIHWSADNPALGQCAVSALVVQDHFGGELLRARVEGVSHYWNRLPDGREVDLTRKQFGPSPQVPPGEPKSRDFVLSFPETVSRYYLLARLLETDGTSRT